MLMVFFPTCFEPMKGVSDACPMTSMKTLPMIPRLKQKNKILQTKTLNIFNINILILPKKTEKNPALVCNRVVTY